MTESVSVLEHLRASHFFSPRQMLKKAIRIQVEGGKEEKEEEEVRKKEFLLEIKTIRQRKCKYHVFSMIHSDGATTKCCQKQ